MSEMEERPLSGEVRDRRTQWITFETNDRGHLHMRTLNGHKVVEDPKRTQDILRLLKELYDEA
jgi:Tfp pilus assembly pilus retraction ATPase PilT